MSQPYVGEIRMFAGNFAPAGWMFCEGQLLPISEYETLFNLIGTTYGGDGQSTFGLPDLRGRLPLDMGDGFTIAQTGGAETVTLTTAQIPSHAHTVVASNSNATGAIPSGAYVASGPVMYKVGTSDSTMSANTIGPSGGSRPHSNFQPYLCVDFIISLFGVFPSPT
ncbi:MAG TPA: tail fiber protein [Bryobacteraceae bacterium]|jgi:microcystin-dependent protein